MSWADKQLKKHKLHKMVESAMNDRRYIEVQKKQLDEMTRKTFDCFLIISVAFLHDRMGFGKKRLLDFIDYAVEQMHFVEELPDYFESMNAAIRDETGVDVLKNEIVERKGGAG